MALVALIGGADAFAQGSLLRFEKFEVQVRRQAAEVIQAPIGHRQPRLGDVRPARRTITDPNDPLSKENAALDRKIKSICRGC